MKNRILAATIALDIAAGGFTLGRAFALDDCADLVARADRTIAVTTAMATNPDRASELRGELSDIGYATARAECLGETR